MGRRIKRQFENQAVNLSGLYHDYYDGHSLIETRAANMVSILKQNVWGLTYVDELVQTSFSPPSSTVYATHNLFVLQSPSYDVMALITPTGHMIERYEYSPSGERFVFGREKTIQIGDADWDGDCDTADEAIMDANDASNGLLEAGDFDADLDVEASGGDDTILQNNLNDSVVGLDDLPEKLYPQLVSTPIDEAIYGSASNKLPLCAFGFQGLMHDEQVMTGATTSPVYNRVRTWLPHLRRYGQRDPLGYVDGMSLYAGYHVMHGGVDPSGMKKLLIGITGRGHDPQEGKPGKATQGNHDLENEIVNKVGLPPADVLLVDWDVTRPIYQWLHDKLDDDGDNHICKNEVQDLDLRIVGFSNGASTAINIARKIREGEFVPIEDGGRESSLYFDVDVPIEHLVTIDGATVGTFALFGRMPKVPKNVNNATNYYQQRGGSSLLYELDVQGKETGKKFEYQDPVGDRIRGNEVRGAKDVRVDTRTKEKKDFSPGIWFTSQDERIYAKDINHNTIVRYVADEALPLLTK